MCSFISWVCVINHMLSILNGRTTFSAYGGGDGSCQTSDNNLIISSSSLLLKFGKSNSEPPWFEIYLN